MASKQDISVTLIDRAASRASVVKKAHEVFGPAETYRVNRTTQTALDFGTVVALVVLDHFQMVVYEKELKSYDMEVKCLQYLIVCEHPWYEQPLGTFDESKMADLTTTIKDAFAELF